MPDDMRVQVEPLHALVRALGMALLVVDGRRGGRCHRHPRGARHRGGPRHRRVDRRQGHGPARRRARHARQHHERHGHGRGRACARSSAWTPARSPTTWGSSVTPPTTFRGAELRTQDGGEVARRAPAARGGDRNAMRSRARSARSCARASATCRCRRTSPRSAPIWSAGGHRRARAGRPGSRRAGRSLYADHELTRCTASSMAGLSPLTGESAQGGRGGALGRETGSRSGQRRGRRWARCGRRARRVALRDRSPTWRRSSAGSQRLEAAELFAFDTETTSLDYMRAEIVGLSFALEPGLAAYVPLAHLVADEPGRHARDAAPTPASSESDGTDGRMGRTTCSYDGAIGGR